jgi:cytochrome c-type biogenesis protein CcmE
MAMKSHRKKRLIAIVGSIIGVALVVALVLYALDKKVDLFVTPSEVKAGKAPVDRTFRIGGLVKEGSVKRSQTTLLTEFIVTDLAVDVTVTYDKLMPNLFREGQGVVAMGKMNGEGVFVASNILAKHDEEYKAPEVLDALERSGHPMKNKEQSEKKSDKETDNKQGQY